MLNKLEFEAQRKLYEWGRFEPTTYYQWDKYNSIEHPLYKWQRYTTKTTGTLTYYWKRYNAIQSQTYYLWNKRNITYQVQYNWEKHYNISTIQQIVTRISQLDEYRFPGKISMDLYESPDTSSSSTVLYYGEDYWYDWEDYSGYVQYNGRWIEITQIRNYGSGTEVSGYEISVRNELVDSPGEFINIVHSNNSNAYTPGKNSDGYYYIELQASTVNYYVASATVSNTPANIIYTSTMPVLNRYTGVFSFTDTTAIDYPKYGYISGNSSQYYVFPEENKCFLMNVNVIPANTTVQEITQYYGIGALNGSYYCVETGIVDYIKGSEAADPLAEDPNPNKYPPNGYKDGYWYEYSHSSVDDIYVWNRYPIIHTEVTKYVWNKYDALYVWDKYNYSSTYSFNGSGLTRIPIFKYSLNGNYTTAKCRYNIGSSTYQSGINLTKYSNVSSIFTSANIPNAQGKVTFYPDEDNRLRITNLNDVSAFRQFVMNYQIEWNTTNNEGTVYAYVDEVSTKGDLIGIQTSINPDAYEEGPNIDGYYYEKAEPFRTVGSINEQKTSYNADEYPNNEWRGDYYYVALTPIIEESNIVDYDNPLSEVTSYDINSYPYPEPGEISGVWYEFKTVEPPEREIDELLQPLVESTYRKAYPDEGYQYGDPNYYYYKYVGNFPTYTRGELEESNIRDIDEDKYPNDERDSEDGYWYVYSDDRIAYDKGQALDPSTITDYYRNKYPDNGEYNGVWYEYNGTTLINIPTVPNSELFGGVTVNKQCNQNGDLQFGMTAGSSITFTVDNYDSRADAYLEAKVYHKICFNNEIPDGTTDYDNDDIYKQVGVYIVKEVVKTRHKATITAYDSLYLLDQNADNFIASNLNTSISVKSLIQKITTALGVQLQTISSSIPNINVTVNKSNIQGKSITYRQLLQWALEIINSFIYANKNGIWVVRQYSNKNITITDNDYCNLMISDYLIPKATKVIENYYGKTNGTGDNLYLINNNDLITETNAQTIVNGVMNNINGMNEYYSASCKLFTDSFNGNELDIGDIINIDIYGVNHTVYIMSKTIQSDGVYIECYGNSKRQSVFDPSTMKLQQVQTIANNAQIAADEAYQKAEEVQDNVTQQGFRINELEGTISGAVTFQDLNGTSGKTTVINGNLIQTGTIDSHRINSDVLYVASNGFITPYNGWSGGSSWTNGIQMYCWDDAFGAYANYVAVSQSGSVLGNGYINMGGPTVPKNQIFANSSRVQMQSNRSGSAGSDHYIGCDGDKCYASESLTITSDREKKTDIEDLEYEEVFKKLRPRKYKMKDGQSERYHTGFIAQEVKDAVIESGLSTQDFAAYVEYKDFDGNDTCGLRYEEIIAMNTMMIQKQQKEIEELKNIINQLTGGINK